MSLTVSDESTKKEKLCVGCDTIKPMTDYYKAGKYWQKRCKPCHNGMRLNYSIKAYTYKKKGFKKLSDELQKNILEDLKTMDCKCIHEKYGEGNFSYNTFLIWKRKGQVV